MQDVKPIFAPEPLSYRIPSDEGDLENPPFPNRKTIAIICFIFAAISIFLAGSSLSGEMHEVQLTRQMSFPGSPWYANHVRMGQVVVGVCSAFLSAAGLLLVGAILALFSNRWGRTLFKTYVVLQLVVSFASVPALMYVMFNSEAGMIFYVGALPGIAAAIFPCVLYFMLRS